jgi:hypothetical protein
MKWILSLLVLLMLSGCGWLESDARMVYQETLPTGAVMMVEIRGNGTEIERALQAFRYTGVAADGSYWELTIGNGARGLSSTPAMESYERVLGESLGVFFKTFVPLVFGM